MSASGYKNNLGTNASTATTGTAESNVGTNGNYWTTTEGTSDDNGVNVNFNSSNMNVNYNNNRKNGRSVRLFSKGICYCRLVLFSDKGD